MFNQKNLFSVCVLVLLFSLCLSIQVLAQEKSDESLEVEYIKADEDTLTYILQVKLRQVSFHS